MTLSIMCSHGAGLVFLNPLVEVSARVTDITCLAQVTFEEVHHILLIYKTMFFLFDPENITELFTCKTSYKLVIVSFIIKIFKNKTLK